MTENGGFNYGDWQQPFKIGTSKPQQNSGGFVGPVANPNPPAGSEYSKYIFDPNVGLVVTLDPITNQPSSDAVAILPELGPRPVGYGSSANEIVAYYSKNNRIDSLYAKMQKALGIKGVAGDTTFYNALYGLITNASSHNLTQANTAPSGSVGKPLTVMAYLDRLIAMNGAAGSGGSESRSWINTTERNTAFDIYSNYMQQLLNRKPSKKDFDEFYSKLNAEESKRVNKSLASGNFQKNVNAQLDVDDFTLNYIVKKIDVSNPNLKGAANTAKQAVDTLLYQNGVSKFFGKANKAKFIKGLLTKDLSEEDIKDSVRKQAKRTYTAFAEDMDADPSASFSDIIAGYAEQYQNTLEINGPVDIADVARLASANGQKLNPYDFEKALKNDRRWGYTKQANQEATDLARSFARSMGVNI